MAASTPATTTLAEAFDKLKSSVSASDAVVFQSTSLQDVWKAARNIEHHQQQRQSVRNLRRIEPLLNAIGKYSNVIGVLCNGTPYLPWIWAPIKLMLQLASEYASIFDKLVTAYAQIAEALPRFDRFEEAFKDNPAFQEVLAMVYADILEFHRRAYKFFRRRGWHILFNSLWKDFTVRFKGILESLARHTELVDKEAQSISIVEARSWRKQADLDLEKRELHRQASQFKDAVAWLAVESRTQEDDLDRLSRRRGPGTCDWILKVPRLTSWISDANDEPVLWLRGIPGAGKSVLCSRIVGFIQKEQRATVAYYLCNSHTDSKDLCSQILRCLVLQLLRHHLELAPHVFENYANRGYNPSMQQLRNLLPELLDVIPATRIIIDGLDECQVKLQRPIMQELLSLFKLPDGHSKILFSSREGMEISKVLRGKRYISLRDEKKDVNTDIELFTRQSLIELRERFSSNEMDRVEKMIVNKANGMFLWVRLVVTSLENCYSIRELQEAARNLPDGLNEAYGRILDRILSEQSPSNKDKAIRILEWMACSFRTLKAWEIQDGIVYQAEVNTILDDTTKLPKTVLELCKPMIEEGPGNTVDFVHFSAKEYMLHKASGPFLQQERAHYNICFSCIAYLSTISCLMDPSFPESQSRLRIVKGYHGLHLYANKFWFAHLLEYLNLRGRHDFTAPSQLTEQLQSLSQFRKESQTPEFHAQLRAIGTLPSIENRTATLDNLPDTKSLVQNILAYRQILAQETHIQKSSEDLQEYEFQNDPTYFSEVLCRYQTIVEFLLDLPTSEAVEELGEEDLNLFKRIYMESSYVCRYGQCPHAWNGFRSRENREVHESLHVKRFKCADATCEFYMAGFANKSALQRHDQKYHTKAEEKAVPIFPQETPGKQHQTAHRDLINASSLPQTIPSGQAFPTRFVPIQPDEIIALPFLSDSLQEYYSDLARNCWDVIEKPGERPTYIPYFEPSTAVEQLCDLTRKLRSEMLVYEQSLAIGAVGIDLSELVLEDLPAHLKKEGDGWHAVFNPQVPRVLDFTILKKFQLTASVHAIAFSHDGKSIAIGTAGLAEVFDILTGTKICSMFNRREGQGSTFGVVHVVTFSPCGKYLTTGSQDGAIRVWDLNSHQVKRILGGHLCEIHELVWFEDGSTIASVGISRTISLWNPDTGHCKLEIPTKYTPTCLSISTDGMYIATGSSDGSAYIYECERGLLIMQYKHGLNVSTIAFSPDGQSLMTGSRGGPVKIWGFDGTSKSSCLASLGRYSWSVEFVKFSHDAAWILTKVADGSVHFCSTMSGVPQAYLVDRHGWAAVAACSPTSNLFATAPIGGRVTLWSYDRYQQTPATNMSTA